MIPESYVETKKEIIVHDMRNFDLGIWLWEGHTTIWPKCCRNAVSVNGHFQALTKVQVPVVSEVPSAKQRFHRKVLLVQNSKPMKVRHMATLMKYLGHHSIPSCYISSSASCLKYIKCSRLPTETDGDCRTTESLGVCRDLTWY